MKLCFLLLLSTVTCNCYVIDANTQQKEWRSNLLRFQSRHFIIKCCGFTSCIFPGVARRSTSTTSGNKLADSTLATDGLNAETTTDFTDVTAAATTEDHKNSVTTDIVLAVTTMLPATGLAPTSVNLPDKNSATTGNILAVTTMLPATGLAPTSVNLPEKNSATTGNILAMTTMLPATGLVPTSVNLPDKVATAANLATTAIPPITTTLSSACVKPCPASCNCSGDALVLDAKGELTSESMKGYFILKCGKEVNTTAHYFSRPNKTDFNNSEMVCCSVCSIPKSNSAVKKRAVVPECLYDFQKAYLENVNGEMKLVFSLAGFRGDCSFMVGKKFTITWEPIAFCKDTVRYFGSNDTACSVVKSWQSCGSQIQNNKLPADPYCEIVGPTTCGQSFTYSCLTSNNLTSFQSLTQGLLLERVSNWAYFFYIDVANEKDYIEAASYCESRMMDLAVFDTIAEIDAALPWFKATAAKVNSTAILHAIIGLDDFAVAYKFVVTKTGAPAPALQWIANEPDGGTVQDCVALVHNYPTAGVVGMLDYSCGFKFLFLCKVPAEFTWIV